MRYIEVTFFLFACAFIMVLITMFCAALFPELLGWVFVAVLVLLLTVGAVLLGMPR
jgi:hypothetical protein